MTTSTTLEFDPDFLSPKKRSKKTQASPLPQNPSLPPHNPYTWLLKITFVLAILAKYIDDILKHLAHFFHITLGLVTSTTPSLVAEPRSLVLLSPPPIHKWYANALADREQQEDQVLAEQDPAKRQFKLAIYSGMMASD